MSFALVNPLLERKKDEIQLFVPSEVYLGQGESKTYLMWKLKPGKGPSIGGGLNAFTRLSKDPSNERILDFAKEWGILGLCDYCCRPKSHDEKYCVQARGLSFDSEEANINSRGFQSERIEDWVYYLAQVKSFLNISANLCEFKLGKAEDWHNIHGHNGYLSPLGLWESGHHHTEKERADQERWLVESFDNYWPFLSFNPAWVEEFRSFAAPYLELVQQVPFAAIQDWFLTIGKKMMPGGTKDWLSRDDISLNESVKRYFYALVLIEERQNLADRISDWAGPEYANLIPQVVWGRKDADAYAIPSMKPIYTDNSGISYYPLFVILTVQLIAALTSGTFICDECKIPFTLEDHEPRNRVAKGRSHYCSADCKHDAQVRQKREWYNRNPEKVAQQKKEKKAKAKREPIEIET